MVSIILPVLNGEKTIRNTIESVLNQTYPDFELLIVDNGSTDGTCEICQRYERYDSRIHLFHSSVQGVVAGRRLGVENAQGKYLAFLDADDTFKREMLVKMMTAIEETDAEIASCGYEEVLPEGQRKYCYPIKSGILNTDEFFECLFEPGTLGFLWNKLYTRKTFAECVLPKDMEVCEDTFINCSLMRKPRRIVMVQECLYSYFINPLSVTHNIKKKIDSEGNWKYLISYRKIRRLFDDESEKARRIQIAEWWIIKLGVEELSHVGKQESMAKKKLICEMRKTLVAVLFSRESLKFKLSYCKCCLLQH